MKGGCTHQNDPRPRIAPGPFCPSDVSGLIPSCRLVRLRPFLDWARRQLQYRSPLPRSEVSDKNDCTVREFQRVVMLVWLVEGHLAEVCRSEAAALSIHRAASLN